MTYKEIEDLCKHGKVGIIPGWKGFLKWNYAKDEIQFVNGDYSMTSPALRELIQDRTDLYYII